MRNSRLHWPDLASGIMLIAFSVAGYILNLEHPMGTARRMGPGYLPFMTFLLLVILGVFLLIRGFISGPIRIAKWAWIEASIITASLLVFAVTIERLGIIVAIFISVMIANCSEPKFKPMRAAAGAIGLIIICVSIFVWGLDIRLPLFPWSR